MYSVYIHVPFCMKRCGYCDFNTYTAHDLGGGASRENYANLAVREMVLVRQWQESQGICEPPAATVFFGGGTPTILPTHDLVRMLHAVRDIWGLEPDAEVTAEANPDTVDDRYIAELKDGGLPGYRSVCSLLCLRCWPRWTAPILRPMWKPVLQQPGVMA